jgi:teichuronic acid biosynthesis glycosyltransferase TuaG
MPSYNASRFIAQSIQSVLLQTYQFWELLVTDDCSVDGSALIIKSYAHEDKRIKLFELNKNVGAAEARNVAIREARGDYIAFLDSDDIWTAEKLQLQLSFMKSFKRAFSFTSYALMTEQGEFLKKIIPVPAEISYRHYLRNTIIGCLTVIIDRSKTGDFEMPLLRSSHDMALWLMILKRGFTAYGLNQVLAYYRIVANSNTARKYQAALDVWRVYRDIEKLNILSSSWSFLGYCFNAIRKRI